MRPIPPTELITTDVPDFTSGAAKPVAFQPVSNNRLLPTLALVVVAHILIISFLLIQFGWPFGAQDVGKSDAGPTAIIIPVTLEASETEEAEKAEADQKSENTPPQSTQPPINDSTQDTLQTAPETQAKEITIETVKPPVSEPLQPPQPSQPSQPESSNSNRTNTDASTSKSTSTNTNTNTNTNTSISTKANTAATQVPLNDSKSGVSGRPADNEGNLPLIAAQIEPNYLHRPNPVYPPLSKQRREEGTVLLRVSLDAQGIVRDIAVERSSLFNRLDQAALEAVRQWRFVPARRGSATLPSSVIVPIEFKHQ